MFPLPFARRCAPESRLLPAGLLAVILWASAVCLPVMPSHAAEAIVATQQETITAESATPRPKLKPLGRLSRGTVANCLDGDTLTLTNRRTVRLAGIDTPEMRGRKGKPQYYAREARDLLRDVARGKAVSFFQAGKEEQDRYGRLVADVQLENGRSLNAVMLEEGAAYFYPHDDLAQDYQDWLRSLQARAIRERRGMWARLLSQPIALQSYTGNKRSLRFFPADSREAQSIKPRNRVHFGTLMDAFLAGYAPARNASPWPEVQ